MKKILILILILTLLPVMAFAQKTQTRKTQTPKTQTAPTQTSPFKTQKERLSYSIGLNVGANLKAQGIEVNPQLIAQAISDVFSGKKPLMTDTEVQETLTSLQNDMKAKAMSQAEDNKKKGDAFLAANSKKPGVVTLPSGLQYKVIKNGTGPKPKATDTVITNYRGTLLNGNEFDSSYKRNQPATFPVNAVIKGWTEALQLMPVGSKWELYVPPTLAYGERGAGGVIGPNETLVFEVELLSIKSAQTQQ
jgi:FKBP-type peptidyl-prolyl cis-trans isomerase FklB